MISVALWTKFPEEYVRSKIQPKLKLRGIQVDRLLTERSRACDLTSVDAVLCMHEIASHPEYHSLVNLANANDKLVVTISRKASHWERDLSRLQPLMERNSMPAPHSVSDEKLEPFLRKYIELRKEGFNHERMVKNLAPFYQRGELTNGNQLATYISNLRNSKRAPKFFLDFMKEQLVVKQCREEEIVQEQKRENLGEAEMLEQMVNEEITKIKIERASLEKERADFEAQKAAFNRKPQNDILSKIVRHLAESVEFQLSSKEDAFDRIVELQKKLNA